MKLKAVVGQALPDKTSQEASSVAQAGGRFSLKNPRAAKERFS